MSEDRARHGEAEIAHNDGALRLLLDARRTYRGGPAAIEARQRARLSEIVAFTRTRTRSRAYAELYRDLPGPVEDPRQLPVTGKAALMGRFDDWVTDPRVTLAGVQAFVADSSRIGRPFPETDPDRGPSYVVSTTSGTTGTRGIFLIDRRALAVAAAMSARMVTTWLNPAALPRLLAGRGRLALSYSCTQGLLHVNADWVILEPVDADHQPTPAGKQSHTVLVTNLANRIQPILRYDLGDSVLARPGPCPCGNPLPAIRVQGRTADLLTVPTPLGGAVTLTPLALTTRLDRLPGIALFQIIQTAPTELSVRLQAAPGADPEQTWAQAHRELTELLAHNGLAHVVVRRADQAPQPATGGKYRLVQPLDPSPS